MRLALRAGDIGRCDRQLPILTCDERQVRGVTGKHHAQATRRRMVVGDGLDPGERIKGDHGRPLATLEAVSSADSDHGTVVRVEQSCQPRLNVGPLGIMSDHNGHVATSEIHVLGVAFVVDLNVLLAQELDDLVTDLIEEVWIVGDWGCGDNGGLDLGMTFDVLL